MRKLKPLLILNFLKNHNALVISITTELDLKIAYLRTYGLIFKN